MLNLGWLGRVEKKHTGRLTVVFYWKVDSVELSVVFFWSVYAWHKLIARGCNYKLKQI